MYFLCSATERQHSTNTGAYMWLLDFHWGESFHWLSFVLIANISHNHASPDKCVSHLKPNVYSPKPSLFLNYLWRQTNAEANPEIQFIVNFVAGSH